MILNNINNLISITESVQQAAGNALWDNIKHAGKQFGYGVTDIFRTHKFKELENLKDEIQILNMKARLAKVFKSDLNSNDIDELNNKRARFDELKDSLNIPKDTLGKKFRIAGKVADSVAANVAATSALGVGIEKLTSSNDKEKYE